MNIQSLSICVPAQKCINKCAFCVSRMHTSPYQDNIMMDSPMSYIFEKDYLKRLEYARDNGCNTVMITGQAEPQQNRNFLAKFSTLNSMLRSPFKNIEMQTTGAMLDEEYLEYLRNYVGVTTISISVSSLINDDLNNETINTPKKGRIELSRLCGLIKKLGFNLRLSLNITSVLMNDKCPSVSDIFRMCQEFGADQVTFRKMYSSNSNTEQDIWIENHKVSDSFYISLNNYIKEYGNYIDTLEYGNDRYSVCGMSVVVDDDCMAKSENKQSLKYLILRPNCKLYSKWDDKGSLIF